MNNDYTIQNHQYKAALLLNRWGVAFLELQCYREAMDAFGFASVLFKVAFVTNFQFQHPTASVPPIPNSNPCQESCTSNSNDNDSTIVMGIETINDVLMSTSKKLAEAKIEKITKNESNNDATCQLMVITDDKTVSKTLIDFAVQFPTITDESSSPLCVILMDDRDGHCDINDDGNAYSDISIVLYNRAIACFLYGRSMLAESLSKKSKTKARTTNKADQTDKTTRNDLSDPNNNSSQENTPTKASTSKMAKKLFQKTKKTLEVVLDILKAGKDEVQLRQQRHVNEHEDEYMDTNPISITAITCNNTNDEVWFVLLTMIVLQRLMHIATVTNTINDGRKYYSQFVDNRFHYLLLQDPIISLEAVTSTTGSSSSHCLLQTTNGYFNRHDPHHAKDGNDKNEDTTTTATTEYHRALSTNPAAAA